MKHYLLITCWSLCEGAMNSFFYVVCLNLSLNLKFYIFGSYLFSVEIIEYVHVKDGLCFANLDSLWCQNSFFIWSKVCANFVQNIIMLERKTYFYRLLTNCMITLRGEVGFTVRWPLSFGKIDSSIYLRSHLTNYALWSLYANSVIIVGNLSGYTYKCN